MWEKCVQIKYSSINNSKIYPKLTKPIDRTGRIWTAYLLCTRITLETTALRVICGGQVSDHIGRPNRRIPLASVLLYSYRSTSQIQL